MQYVLDILFSSQSLPEPLFIATHTVFYDIV